MIHCFSNTRTKVFPQFVGELKFDVTNLLNCLCKTTIDQPSLSLDFENVHVYGCSAI